MTGKPSNSTRKPIGIDADGTPEMAEEVCNLFIAIAQQALDAATRLRALQSPVLRRKTLNAAMEFLDIAAAMLDQVPPGSGVALRVGHARDVVRDVLSPARSDDDLRLMSPQERWLVLAARAVVNSVTVDVIAMFSSHARATFFSLHDAVKSSLLAGPICASARNLVRALDPALHPGSLVCDTRLTAHLFDLQRALADYDAAEEK